MSKFTIIMQCFLGEYPGAASNREEKLIRAVDSVLAQTFTDWELFIVADGCDKTYELIEKHYPMEKRIDCILVQKQPLWSGSCRNFALKYAKGDWITYLDADDYYGPNHLEVINKNLSSYDFVWFNDKVKAKDGSEFERRCSINQKFQHGTSNIAHKAALKAMWSSAGYGYDDWGLVQHLLKLTKNYIKIETPEYVVCHIPNTIDL
jgi:glycosyltransferase involved in cell wall biosynthesis